MGRAAGTQAQYSIHPAAASASPVFSISATNRWPLPAGAAATFEPEGLRITLSPGAPKGRPGTGFTTGLTVHGDFEITVRYEILHEPTAEETGDFGTRLTLTAGLEQPGCGHEERAGDRDVTVLPAHVRPFRRRRLPSSHSKEGLFSFRLRFAQGQRDTRRYRMPTLSEKQAKYIGVSPDGPFKPDHYRY